MRKILCLTFGLMGAGALLTSSAFAQGMGGQGMGGQMGGGMGGGHGKGQGRGHRGGQGVGAPGGGQMPGDARPAAAVIPIGMQLKGLVTIAGETKTLKSTPMTLDKPDMSALYAQRAAQVTLDGVDITTSGAATLVDNTRQYGMNSALLIDSGAHVAVQNGKIATTGQGATAVYASGEGSAVTLTGASLMTEGSGAYGVEIRPGADFTATDLSVATQSDHAVALSIPRGRPVHLTGGHFTTAGPLSPVFLLAGGLEATGLTAEARRAEAVVIIGSHPVSFTDSHLTGDYGVMIYHPIEPGALAMGDHPMGPPNQPPGAKPGMRPATDMMGAADPMAGGLSLHGGTVTGRRAAFYVTNMHTHITLDGVVVTSASGILLKSTADQWGELGRNGGDTTLDARNQTLTGDFVTDVISHIAVNLSENSHLTGKATRNTDITLDATSTWTLTDDGSVGKLTGDLSRIDSQGHTLSYDKNRNPTLNNQTLPLPGGGKLVPGL